MPKRVPVFWLLFSLTYVLLEVVFRADVMLLASSAQSPEQMLILERVGRFLSSVGFAAFVCAWASPEPNSETGYRTMRRLLLFPLFFACYHGASALQVLAIDYYAKTTAPELKREMMLASMTRDQQYFSLMDKQPGFLKKSPDEQIRLSFLPAMVIGDPHLNTYSDSQIRQVLADNNAQKLKQNAKSSDDDVFRYHLNWMKTVAYHYITLTSGDHDFSGMSQHEAKQAYQYAVKEADRILLRAAKEKPISLKQTPMPVDDYQAFVMDNLRSSFALYDADLDMLDRDINLRLAVYKPGQDTALPEQYSSFYKSVYPVMTLPSLRQIDFHLEMFSTPERIGDLKAYYPHVTDIKNTCKSFQADKNEIHFLLHHGHNIRAVLSGDDFPQQRIDTLVRRMLLKLNGKIAHQPKRIVCNYAYEDFYQRAGKLAAYLKSTRLHFNNAVARQLKRSPKLARTHFYYKHAAMNALSERIAQTEKRTLLHQFSDLSAYNTFVRGLDLSSAKNFRKSVHRYHAQTKTNFFLTYTKEAGVPFAHLISRSNQTRKINDEKAFFTDPAIMQTFKKWMPYAFDTQGRLIAGQAILVQNKDDYFNGLSESTKQAMRHFYNEMLTGKQVDMVENASLFDEGKSNQRGGEQIAKGFVAPSFVLGVSNVMIALSLIQIVTTFLAPYLGAWVWPLRCGMLYLLLIAPGLRQNEHLHEHLPSQENPLAVALANLTANTQPIYDTVFPELVRPHWLYHRIKQAHTRKHY